MDDKLFTVKTDMRKEYYHKSFLIMNTKDNLKEVDIDRANRVFENFFKLHNKEIKRIRKLDKKQKSSIGL
jgi:hypothetical protein